MTCNRNLRWYELIPVFSFLIQGGRCRRCSTRISYQYPFVEIGTGLIFALIAYKFLPLFYMSYYGLYTFTVAVYLLIYSLLVIIAVYDLRHKVIPDKLVFIFTIVAFASLFIDLTFAGPVFVLPTLMNFIAGPLLALPFVLIWFLSKGKLMGLGDGKLILGLGWMLGLSSGITAVIIAFWIGTIISVPLVLWSKNKFGMKTEVPFAPFLIISSFVTFLFGFNLFSLIRLFSF